MDGNCSWNANTRKIEYFTFCILLVIKQVQMHLECARHDYKRKHQNEICHFEIKKKF